MATYKSHIKQRELHISEELSLINKIPGMLEVFFNEEKASTLIIMRAPELVGTKAVNDDDQKLLHILQNMDKTLVV